MSETVRPKKAIREQIKSQRRTISSAESEASGKRLISSLKKIPTLPPTALLYYPVQNEISTLPIFHWAQQKGMELYFPRMEKKDLSFHRVENLSELQPEGWTFQPPQENKRFENFSHSQAFALVPGLAFTRLGDRLGFGRGFYDRFLEAHPNLLRLGIAYEFQILASESSLSWKPEPHDQRMDWVLSPSAIWGSPRPEIPFRR